MTKTNNSAGKSFLCALAGLKIAIRERNMKIHLTAAAIAILAGILTDISRIEWILVAMNIGAVLAAETFNTALELLSDKVCPAYDRLIKNAKDLSAGAVLVTATSAAVTGIIVFLPKLLSR